MTKTEAEKLCPFLVNTPSEDAEEEVYRREFLHSLGRSYAHGWCGAECILPALHESMATGVPARFFIADHHNDGDTIYERVSVALGDSTRMGINDTAREWRYCGEGDDPDGASSHAVTPGSDDAVEAAILLAFSLAQSVERIARLHGKRNRLMLFREKA